MNSLSESDEFYVGYLPGVPPAMFTSLKGVLAVIFILVVGISFLLVFNQREFSTADFEFGIPTQLEGIVYKTPVPHLRISLGVSWEGAPISKAILLVGYGKSGAAGALEEIEKMSGQSIVGKKVTLNGYLIYGDGKTIFQITENINRNVNITSGTIEPQISMTDAGRVSVVGEIVDSKCYFGVMKPGEGKPHRSCAIRCISGGIPPVFHAAGSNGYYILVNEELESINREVLSLVGDQIELKGTTMIMDDWKVLVVNTTELRSLSKWSSVKQNLLAMEKGMTVCGKN